jgi:drebrin-like protein
VQKVADASGSKYSAASSSPVTGPAPPVSSKPAFTPTRSGGSPGFNPLANTRQRQGVHQDGSVDEDGWGADAPPVTRSQLEKVQSAYQPTKVNMAELTKQKPEPSRFNDNTGVKNPADTGDVVKGGYQPVGKVDIAAIRAQAQKKGDDRPMVVKGAYEPVGKVDIAAIRAKAQKPSDDAPRQVSPNATGVSSTEKDDEPKSLAARSAAFTQSERLTSLPKPKVAKKFGSNASSFAGTKAPTPGIFGLQSAPPTAAPAPVGAASRTFADEGGKTPAQIWAEKKARERGVSSAGDISAPVITSPILNQTSGGGEWKSGYTGKTWAPVATTITGRSGTSSLDAQKTGEQEHQEEDTPTSPVGGIGALRDKFKGATPMGAPTVPRATTREPSPPPLDTSTKPFGGVAMPGLPTRPRPSQTADEDDAPNIPPRTQRSPSPPTPAERDPSPVRIAMPVARSKESEIEAPRNQLSPPIPAQSIEKNLPHEDEDDEELVDHDSRATGAAVAVASFGQETTAHANQTLHASGKSAIAQYDYEKAEDNELELTEGETITNIEMVDEDWWMGTNSKGDSGLFPSNYVELVEAEEEQPPPQPPRQSAASAAPVAPVTAPAPSVTKTAPAVPTATALYDYEAAEDNELSFEEGSKITGLVSTFPGFYTDDRANINRNFLTRIGGLVTKMETLVCSQQTMCNLMNERKLLGGARK